MLLQTQLIALCRQSPPKRYLDVRLQAYDLLPMLINISGVQAKANRNTKDLEKREKELDKREKALAAREAKLASSGRGAAVGTDVSVSTTAANRAEFCKACRGSLFTIC